MKTIYYIILSVILVACKAVQYDTHDNVSAREVVITAGKNAGEELTKTIIVGTNARWSITDALEIFDNANQSTKGAKFALIAGDNRSSAMFKGTFEDGSKTKRNIYAVYPYQSGSIDNSQKTYTFSIPSVQSQNTECDSISIGKYTYMVARPVNSTPDEIEISLEQLVSIIDFKITNFPTDKTITKLVIKANEADKKPFITKGSLDITAAYGSSNFGKITGATFSNSFTLMLSGITESNFTSSIVVFPFQIQSSNFTIIATTLSNNSSKTETYSFAKNNLDLTRFARGKRVSTTLDFSGKLPDAVSTEIYSAWDGVSYTEPTTFDKSRKIITIAQASDLAWLAQQTNTGAYNGFEGYTVEQKANLDLGGVFDGSSWSGAKWTPIGSSIDKPFKGNYDGGGFNIRNVYCSNGGVGYIYAGLFGVVGGIRISNVNIETGYFSSSATTSLEFMQNPYAYSGAVCALIKSSNHFTLENCINGAYVTATASVSGFAGSASFNFAGGIVGLIESTQKVTIKDCINSGAIRSIGLNGMAAGICGEVKSSVDFTNCINNSSVQSEHNSAGICSKVSSNVAITNCTNNAQMKSSNNLGGLCAEVSGNLDMINCLNNGNLESEKVGGLIVHCNASAQKVNITNCINKGKLNGYPVLKSNGEVAGIILSTNAQNIVIENCENQAELTSTGISAAAAGICLTIEQSKAKITKCRNFATIYCSSNYYSNAAGIANNIINSEIEITECENRGDLFSNANSINAGIVSTLTNSYGKITNCTNNGFISSNAQATNCTKSYAGGICGTIVSDSGKSLVIQDCTNNEYVSAYTVKQRLYATKAFAGGICSDVNSSSNNVYFVRNVNNSQVNATTQENDKGMTTSAGGICATSNNLTVINCISTSGIQCTDPAKSGILIGEAANTIISSCYTPMNGIPSLAGFIGAAKHNVTIYDSYHHSERDISTGQAVISGGGRFSEQSWPKASVKGWGATAPEGWNSSTLSTWTNPWASLGNWNEYEPLYPTLK